MENSLDHILFNYDNCDLTVSENTIKSFTDNIIFKKTINYVNGANKRLICKTSVYLCSAYFFLDNDFFSAKIFYNMINSVDINDGFNVLFGHGINLHLISNANIYLNISDKNDNLNEFKNELINKVKNPPILAQNKFLKVFNGLIIESQENLYKLEKITNFKKDLSFHNKNVLEEVGILLVYDDHLKIENALFIQEFSYDVVKEYNITDNNIELNLMNNSSIIIKLNENNMLDDETKNLLISNIKNPPLFVDNYPIKEQIQSYDDTEKQVYKPYNKKSGAIAFILNLLFCGAGYAYVDKWGRFLLTFFIIWPIMILIGLFTAMLLPLVFWIYVVVNTNNLVNKYNEGIIY